MRKTLLVIATLFILVIATLFITVQVFAGTVTMSVSDEGSGWAAIRYSADANVSGFGLKVTADSGASFTDISDYNVGECTASLKGYGIFPGTIDVNELTGVVDDNGTPIAPNTDPGAASTGFSTGTLVLEMGALYVEGNEPALSGTLILVKVDGDCNVCVETEPIRGNIVLTDANEATVAYSPNCVSVSAGAGAVCPGDITGSVTGYVTGGPPEFIDTFDANLWEGADGKTDYTDLQSLIYLLLYDGTAMVMTPVPAYAAAGDITGSVTGYVTGGPPEFIDTFDANLWEGADGDVDYTDLQSLIYLLLYDGTSMVYTCP